MMGLRRANLDLELFRLLFRRQPLIDPAPVVQEAIDGSLGGAEREGCASNAALDRVFADLLDHGFLAKSLHFLKRHALNQLGDDRAPGLGDRAADPLKACFFNRIVIADLEIERDEIATSRVATSELDAGPFHPVLVSRVFKVVENDLDVFLSVEHGRLFLRGLFGLAAGCVGDTDEAAPFRPGTIVVADIVVAEQIL